MTVCKSRQLIISRHSVLIRVADSFVIINDDDYGDYRLHFYDHFMFILA